ncbi:MAG: hypothetical protein JSW60_00350 [Thermoplasmatales archaeon]|nr:MAG: hypothetical protein JSW60_00350 [Thermoplasmatales archaeon]
MIGCILSIAIILLPSTVALDTSINEENSEKVKYLVFGFFPDTRGDWLEYYFIPGIIWARVHQNNLIILWLGTFIIIGITDERPDYGFGRIP